MKTLRLYGPGDIRLMEEPEPSPASGEALLQIASVGVCGSDLTWFVSSGIGSAKLERPLILGHEFSAVALTGQFAGKRVAVDPAIPCNHCRHCIEGNPNFCEATRFAGHAPDDGALRERMAWPEELLHPLPDELSFEDGVMLEPLGVAIHAMDLGKIRLGDKVGVFGCGPIGLLMVQLALASGAERVLATDPLEHRRNLAGTFGAQPSSARNGEEIAPLIRSDYKGGLDVAFEIAGEDDAVEAAIRSLRPGGKLILGGIPRDDRTSFCASEARRKGLTIKLVRRMKHTYPRAIALTMAGTVRLQPLVTHVFPLEKADEAFATAVSRSGLKVCLRPTT
ncbi:zinc-binding dehydrogenase [Pseudodesulfovibrio indicus]|uniref:zinc-binding dehydrogenase n=1 Tax=Pseudodesulfovibrio indicus TaxID=1716143 RepID=UPI00292E0881|nr:alcohol dehydrogenase catalytic domain-containing protein [Pseudodesulfovibrio indicus]